MKRTLLLLVLLFSSLDLSSSQTTVAKKSGCTILDKQQPAQYIVYETKSEPPSDLFLRLKNNTDCAITVETDDKLPTLAIIFSNGAMRINRITDPQEGPLVRLHYFIQNRRQGTALTRGYGWGDSVFTYELSPGQSVVFNVSTVHIKRRLDIAVPFSYSWEKTIPASSMGGVTHHVYFLYDDLPLSAKR